MNTYKLDFWTTNMVGMWFSVQRWNDGWMFTLGLPFCAAAYCTSRSAAWKWSKP